MGLEFEQQLVEDEFLFIQILSKKVTGQQFILEIKNFISTANFVSHNTIAHRKVNKFNSLTYSRITY